VYEAAVYAQDEWQVTPKLYLTYGLRYDVSRFPTTPAADPALASSVLQIDNTIQPSDHNNLAPRVGFTYDPEADGRQVIRGGSGLFFGRAPYVLYGNTLSNTGRTQLALNCLGAQAPQPDFPAHDGDPSTIPTTCLGGGAAAASKASPVVFSSDFQQTQAWKTNLAYDRLIAANWRLTLEGVYTRTTHDYVVHDVNLDATPNFTIVRGIPVFQPAASIPTTGSSAGRTNIAFSRRDPGFHNVFVQSSDGEATSAQGIVQVRGAIRWGSLLSELHPRSHARLQLVVLLHRGRRPVQQRSHLRQPHRPVRAVRTGRLCARPRHRLRPHRHPALRRDGQRHLPRLLGPPVDPGVR
jgi:hypothetical protein